MEDLIKYLKAKEQGSWGWRTRYGEEVAADESGKTNYASLSGHYSRLLDEVIEIVGLDRLYRLADIFNEMHDEYRK